MELLSYGPFISRKQAQAQGLRHYYNGRKCKRLHTPVRFTSTGQCPHCVKDMNDAVMRDPKKAERRRMLNRGSAAKRVAENSQWIVRRRAASAKHRKAFTQENGQSRNNWYYQNNIQHRLGTLLRSRTHKKIALHGGSKSVGTIELLGCTVVELTSRFEALFTPGMTWENMGEWHIDHIRPCASFDLTDPEQQRQCFHYTNLQPLWAEDNLRKSDKWEPATMAA